VSEKRVPDEALHNVAETAPAPWTDGGRELRRVPSAVASNLNVSARERVRHPVGCELRLVPLNGPVDVTLSAAEETVVRPFWGDFQHAETIGVGPTPTTVSLTVPEPIDALTPDASASSTFAPAVCRLRFERNAPVAVHGIEGEHRPPEPDELPDRRVLVYGTSITEGADATGNHLSYVAGLVRRLAVDAINLGVSGSAFCEPAIGEYLADRSDWDACVLSVSVNMADRGFTVEQFRERAGNLVETVVTTHPSKPVVGVTLYPYHADLVAGGDRERAQAYRRALREVVADASASVSVVEGPDVMEPAGLCEDLLHPGDIGHAQIAEGLASHLDEREW
jgi:lysophospholipase L1-like esterase